MLDEQTKKDKSLSEKMRAVRNSGKGYTYKGKQYSLRDLALMFGCSKSTMHERLRRYGSPEKPNLDVSRIEASVPVMVEHKPIPTVTPAPKPHVHNVNCNRAEDAVSCPVDCSPDDWRVDDACRPSPRGRRRVLRSVGLLTVCSSRSALPTSSNDFLPNSVSSFSSLVNPARFLCRTKDSASSSDGSIVKFLVWNGQSKTAAEWAKEFGCKPDTIRLRFKKYNSPEPPPGVPVAQALEFEGESHTAAEWASIVGVSVTTIKARFRATGSPYKSKEERRKERLARRPASAAPMGAYDNITIEDVTPDEYQRRVQNLDAKVLMGFDGDWMTLDGWAYRVMLSVEEVADNFLKYGYPISPEDLQKRYEIADDKMSDGYKAYKRDMKRIMEGPDDGQPLKSMFGVEKPDDLI